jgi:hypothetical protein
MRRIRGERRLKAKEIEKLRPGVHEDGGGLRLVVEPSGSRRWVLRVTIAGKRRNRGLGPYPRWCPWTRHATRPWTSGAPPATVEI